MAETKRPLIFDYADYRKYLRDLYTFLKAEKKIVTYRWLAKRGGFTSPNFIKLVIDGERNVSDESIPKIALAFGLERSEATYFKNLVHFAQAGSVEEKAQFGKKLANNRRLGTLEPLKADQFNYFSDPLNVIVRELMTLSNPPRTVAEIQVLLGIDVSAVSVERSIELLLRLELLEKDPVNGGWLPTSNAVWSGDEVVSQALASFHRHMIAAGGAAIENFKSDQRDISSVTVGLSKKNFQVLKKMVQDFRQVVMQLSEDDSGREEIFQMNVQLFPLAQKTLGGKK